MQEIQLGAKGRPMFPSVIQFRPRNLNKSCIQIRESKKYIKKISNPIIERNNIFKPVSSKELKRLIEKYKNTSGNVIENH